jgi:hypothetical protein
VKGHRGSGVHRGTGGENNDGNGGSRDARFVAGGNGDAASALATVEGVVLCGHVSIQVKSHEEKSNLPAVSLGHVSDIFVRASRWSRSEHTQVKSAGLHWLFESSGKSTSWQQSERPRMAPGTSVGARASAVEKGAKIVEDRVRVLRMVDIVVVVVQVLQDSVPAGFASVAISADSVREDSEDTLVEDSESGYLDVETSMSDDTVSVGEV